MGYLKKSEVQYRKQKYKYSKDPKLVQLLALQLAKVCEWLFEDNYYTNSCNKIHEMVIFPESLTKAF